MRRAAVVAVAGLVVLALLCAELADAWIDWLAWEIVGVPGMVCAAAPMP